LNFAGTFQSGFGFEISLKRGEEILGDGYPFGGEGEIVVEIVKVSGILQINLQHISHGVIIGDVGEFHIIEKLLWHPRERTSREGLTHGPPETYKQTCLVWQKNLQVLLLLLLSRNFYFLYLFLNFKIMAKILKTIQFKKKIK